MGKIDWDVVTNYADVVTTTLKTVTFPKVQEQVYLRNQGNANFTYTIGSKSGTLTPGQSVTVKEDVSFFTLQAVSGTHTFELRANEKGTEIEDTDNNLPSDVAGQLTSISSQLTQKAQQSDLLLKADKTYVDTQISNIGNASPKGTYATLTDLQTAFPTGTTGIYVVTADGKWYYWYGSAWTAGGTYQSTGISDGAISKSKMSDTTPTANLFDKTKVTADSMISSAGTVIAGVGNTVSDYIPVTPSTQYIAKNGYVIAYYDVNKTFISRTVNATTTTDYLFTTPANASYIRLAIPTTNIDAQMIVLGNTLPSTYVANQVSIKWLNVTNENIAPSSIDKSKMAGMTPTGNLFDKTKISTESMIGAAGTVIGGTGTSVSAFISVIPNKQYIAKYGYVLGFYDANKTFISRTVNSPTTTNYVFTTTASTYYIKVSINTTDVDGQMVLLGGAVPSSYLPYAETLPWLYVPTSKIIDDASIFPKNINNWQGKKWSGLGDSITFQNRWQPYVNGVLGLTFNNYGISGTKVADSTGTDTNAMCRDERINLIDAASDLVSVMGGVNDWANNVPLGAITDTVTNTFYGAYNILVQKLIARFPTKRIVLMTPTQCRYPNRFTDAYGLVNNVGLATGDYAEAVRNIAKKYGFPLVDMNANCGWNDYSISNYVDNESGVFLHPNDTGAKRMAEVAIGGLQRINPIA